MMNVQDSGKMELSDEMLDAVAGGNVSAKKSTLTVSSDELHTSYSFDAVNYMSICQYISAHKNEGDAAVISGLKANGWIH